jgi:hypothetical protein
MQSSYLSISDALSAEEVCPLCLDHYTAADECVCVVCRAASCPGCAEAIDSDGAMRCFACRPVALPLRAQTAPEAAQAALPRPISPDAYAPALPFPLTTSPHGVRPLKPRPAGSVFVGLPPLPPTLARAQRTAIVPSPSTPPPPPRNAIPFRARARAELAIARLRTERTLEAWAQRAGQRWQALRAEWPSYRQRLSAWYGTARVRISAQRRSSFAFVRASLGELRRRELAQRGLARLQRWRTPGLARLRSLPPLHVRISPSAWLGWLRAQRARLPEWSASRWARPLTLLSARVFVLLGRGPARFDQRPKSIARQADPSRPISL